MGMKTKDVLALILSCLVGFFVYVLTRLSLFLLFDISGTEGIILSLILGSGMALLLVGHLLAPEVAEK